MSQDQVRDGLMMRARVLANLHLSGDLDQNHCHKGLVQIAWELGQLHLFEDAVALLRELNPDYFRQVLEGQLEGDPSFAQQCRQLAEQLLLRGYSSLEEVKPTQKEGLA